MRHIFYSLRSRLVLIIILTFIPGIVLLIQVGLKQREQAMDAVEKEAIHLANMASNVQTLMGDNVEAFLLTLAHNPTLRQNDVSSCQQLYSHLVMEHFDYYASFYVADLQGNIVCSPEGMHVPPDFNECDHYRQLIQADDFVVSGYHICKHTGKAVMSIGYPIHDMQNRRILVTNVSIDLAWFYDFARGANLPKGSELIIVDNDGKILSHYPDNEQWRGQALPETGVFPKLLLQQEGVLIGAGLSGDEVLAATSSINGSMSPVRIILIRPTRMAFAEANTTLQRNLLSMLVVLFVVILLTWRLGDALIIKQTDKIIQATRELEKGNLTVRTGVNYGQSELGAVAQAIDRMSEKLAMREAERDMQENKLQEYARNLEHTNKELMEFAFIASHDLQEPLRKIRVFSELLQERCPENLDGRGSDYLNRMQQAAQRMQQLIASLLVFSRVTTSDFALNSVDLNQVLHQVLVDLDWQIEQSQATIHVADLPTIQADPVQMNHLFENLISNAIKFHRKGCPPVIHVYSTHRSASEDQMCEVRVEDKGIGFDEKHADRIFQPFQRLHVHGEYEGTGMGLAICRRIVSQHGGRITVHSKIGVGTTFTIQLPIHRIIERQG